MKTRIVEIRKNILDKNDRLAEQLRERFERAGVLVVNLVGSPGAGKTEVLVQLMRRLREQGYGVAAVTGDLATENDAERLKESGGWVKQILTGTMCHLEAKMVSAVIKGLDLAEVDFLFVENVGNLVCPSGFDLGERLRVMVLNTTEGEDKPLKYPTMTNSVDVVVVNKIDLAEAVGCDVDLIEENVHELRREIPVLRVSARRGDGIDELVNYLIEKK
jgi:hydrogenase nickel incorporation protein HypB